MLGIIIYLSGCAYKFVRTDVYNDNVRKGVIVKDEAGAEHE